MTGYSFEKQVIRSYAQLVFGSALKSFLRCRNNSCSSRSEQKSMPFSVIRMNKLHGPSPKQQMLGQGKYKKMFFSK